MLICDRTLSFAAPRFDIDYVTRIRAEIRRW